MLLLGMPGSVRAYVADIETPIGAMVATATDTHLLLLEFSHRRMLGTQLDRVRRALDCEFERGESPVFATVRKQLDEYFATSTSRCMCREHRFKRGSGMS
jgi:O6-methylguanine-DNA--protein-cysteine methyltransferase